MTISYGAKRHGLDYFLNVSFVQNYTLLVIFHQGRLCGELVH